jgi:hypothetical protein
VAVTCGQAKNQKPACRVSVWGCSVVLNSTVSVQVTWAGAGQRTQDAVDATKNCSCSGFPCPCMHRQLTAARVDHSSTRVSPMHRVLVC